MLAADSLVTDLIFASGEGPDNDALIDALGGEEVLSQRKILDPDMQDPRFEMEVSPSRPFRRRGERRLMLIDDSVAPMRPDPMNEPIISMDLRPAKEALVSAFTALGDHVRLGRLFALGGWGEGVMVAHSAVDMRAWALQTWVIDPNIDIDGRRRAQPLTQKEFEAKLEAYEKRIEELDEEDILSGLSTFSVDRSDDVLVVSLVDENGAWDTRRCVELEEALIAADRFSVIPGAPSPTKTARAAAAGANASAGGEAGPASPVQAAPSPSAEPAVAVADDSVDSATDDHPRVVLLTRDPRPLLWFPMARFDLGVAATLGRGDWESILSSADADSALRDHIREGGADFVVELEFFSEAFLAGKPLSKPEFETAAEDAGGGARAMEAQLPRFGPGLLLATADGRRFFTSRVSDGAAVAELLAENNSTIS